MCLAIPGKILEIQGDESLYRVGKVDFGGLKKDVHLGYVPDAVCGDYVLVHVGVALQKIGETEANEVLTYLKMMGEELE